MSVERDTKLWDKLDQAYVDFLSDKPAVKDLLVGTYEEIFKRYLQFKQMLAGVALDTSGVEIEDIKITNDIPVRLYTPTKAKEQGAKLPALVVYHGGGWAIGDLDTEHPTCVQFSRDLGVFIVNVDYRLAPKHVFPAAADDCVTALHWTIDNAAKYNIDTSRIALYGTSAGGNLAAATAIYARDNKIPISGLVLRIPATCHPDAFPSEYPNESMSAHKDASILSKQAMDNFYDYYAKNADPKDPRLSPLLADLHGLPYTYFEIAGGDPLRDDGWALYQKLLSAGVEAEANVYSGVPHAFTALAHLEKSQQAAKDLFAGTKKAIKGASA